MKKIIYVGNFSFPLGNAAGKRVYANGKIFRELGYEVIFIGLKKKIDKNLELEETEKEYDGFKFYNFIYPKGNISWLKYNSLFKQLVKLIERTIILKDVSIIVYYGSPSLSLFINKLIKYSKKNNIKIVSDCVDWLTVKTNNPLFNMVKWVDNTYQKSILNKKVDGVIAITDYLDSYYKKAGLKTVVIPPLSPISYKKFEANNNNKVIVYAGLPFRKNQLIKDVTTLKDRIDKTIIILSKVKEKGVKFTFNIYGFNKDEYLFAIPSQKKYVDSLGLSLVFHGMKPNDEITEEISKADFTILFRDINRDTAAGFPTKVSESISCGTPVITTRTSDLDDYIIHEENGFFIESNDVQSLTRILKISKNDISKMKKNCYNSKIFDYKNFTGSMNTFIELI